MELRAAFPRSRQTCPKQELRPLVGKLRSMIIIAILGGVRCLLWLQEHIKEQRSRFDSMRTSMTPLTTSGGLPATLACARPKLQRSFCRLRSILETLTRQVLAWVVCDFPTPTCCT